MNNKLISIVLTIILFAGIFAVSITAVNARGFDFLCFKKQSLIVTLKNEANINTSKDKISKIPQVKIVKIKYRDEEWSKMVNKMDLPKMENPFKNEFIIKVKKDANVKGIYDSIKQLDFVESVKYAHEAKSK